MQRWIAAGAAIVMSFATMGAVSALARAEGTSAIVVTAAAPDEQGSYSMRRVAVDFSGIDTANPAGVDELYSRIAQAAVTACHAPSVRHANERLQAKIDKCQIQARNDAIARARIPALDAAAQRGAGK